MTERPWRPRTSSSGRSRPSSPTSSLRTSTAAAFGRYDGFAYVAAEAYFHLAGGYDAGLQPMQLKYRGKSHWWLLDSEGRVIDLTLAPRETSNFPYHRGKRRPFRYTPAGISRRAQTVVERVLSARG